MLRNVATSSGICTYDTFHSMALDAASVCDHCEYRDDHHDDTTHGMEG